jgi:kynurenine formamidase
MKKIWDFSPPVDSQSPVIPGDTADRQEWVATLSNDCPMNVSAIHLSPHVGAHADAPLHPSTVQHLAELGVKLIGIDSASIDPADSKSLPSHQVIRQCGLRVLENLLLDDVPEGDYELIALPLKLMTADASPVRDVLREL